MKLHQKINQDNPVPIQGVEYTHPKNPITQLGLLPNSELEDALEELVNGYTTCIVAELGAHKTCDMVSRLISTDEMGGYKVEPNFRFDFAPLFESNYNIDSYAKSGFFAEQQLQQLIGHFPTVHQLVRHVIYESISTNVVRLEIQDTSLPFGVVRLVEPQGNGVLWHTDNSDLDMPGEEAFSLAKTNLAIVVFLNDFEGGELELYQLKLTTQQAVDSFRLPYHEYSLDPALLPDNPTVIHPRKGQIVIFDAKTVHRVCPVKTGRRLTLSGFALYNGRDFDLSLYT